LIEFAGRGCTGARVNTWKNIENNIFANKVVEGFIAHVVGREYEWRSG